MVKFCKYTSGLVVNLMENRWSPLTTYKDFFYMVGDKWYQISKNTLSREFTFSNSENTWMLQSRKTTKTQLKPRDIEGLTTQVKH